jgi:hypothetical protein
MHMSPPRLQVQSLLRGEDTADDASRWKPLALPPPPQGGGARRVREPRDARRRDLGEISARSRRSLGDLSALSRRYLLAMPQVPAPLLGDLLYVAGVLRAFGRQLGLGEARRSRD